jgi:hypothetical protein
MANNDHDHGKMDITEQEKTFNGFIGLTVKGAAICIGLLIFLTLLNA